MFLLGFFGHSVYVCMVSFHISNKLLFIIFGVIKIEERVIRMVSFLS